MRLVSNLVRARYRNQVLFRPVSNGSSAAVGRILICGRTKVTTPNGQTSTETTEAN